MNISSLTWMGLIQQSMMSGVAGYGVATVSGADQTTRKIVAVASLLIPVLITIFGTISTWKLNPFRMIKLLTYSAQLTLIFTCRRYELVSFKTAVMLNGIAFLSYCA
jgi:hypothetical protein